MRARANGSLYRVWLLSFLAATTVMIGSGCQTLSYYRQSIGGQLQIWKKQEPIEKVLAGRNRPAALKAKLELVLRLRAFAETNLHLPINGQYLRYADLERRYVVWTVQAAPAFSLEPKKWWYPIVGKLKYRGYFSPEAATNYAARMAEEGFDVHVEGVEAYSTLGWFKDPVLNTFIHHEQTGLAEILFHELAHQRLFAAGDTDFNEAFATAVEQEGTRRWLQAQGDSAAYAEYLAALERQTQFVELVLETRLELEKLFASVAPACVESREMAHLQDAKADIFDRLRVRYRTLRERWGGHDRYDHWFESPLNNAKLNTVAAYYRLVPAFDRLLHEHGGDLKMFYGDAERLAEMPKERRYAELKKRLEEPTRELSGSE